MAIISLELVTPWADAGRMEPFLGELNESLADQIASQVISRVSRVVDPAIVSEWDDVNSTPTVILSIIAMMYAGRTYQSVSVDNISQDDFYGTKLITDAETYLARVVSGEVVILDPLTYEAIPVNRSGFNSTGSGVSFEPVYSEPAFSMEMIF